MGGLWGWGPGSHAHVKQLCQFSVRLIFLTGSKGLVLFRLVSAGFLALQTPICLLFQIVKSGFHLRETTPEVAGGYEVLCLIWRPCEWQPVSFSLFIPLWTESPFFKDNYVHSVYLEPYFAFDVLNFSFIIVLKEIR